MIGYYAWPDLKPLGPEYNAKANALFMLVIGQCNKTVYVSHVFKLLSC